MRARIYVVCGLFLLMSNLALAQEKPAGDVPPPEQPTPAQPDGAVAVPQSPEAEAKEVPLPQEPLAEGEAEAKEVPVPEEPLAEGEAEAVEASPEEGAESPVRVERIFHFPVDDLKGPSFGALGAFLNPVKNPAPEKVVLSGRIQNLFLWRNDSDFDRTAPFYNAQGQHVGLLGTFIAPKLEIRPAKNIKVVWESEVGLNIWSMQDPDQYQMDGDRAFRLAIRQLYSEGTFKNDKFGYRVGYEQFFDPTGLFLGHWMGAANLFTNQCWGKLTLTLAQMPDQTYEGASYDANNFNSDTFVAGLRYDKTWGSLGLAAALWGMHDSQVVGQTLDMLILTAQFSARLSSMTLLLDGGLQYGVTEGRAAGADETTFAWAAQATAEFKVNLKRDMGLLAVVNALALSPDDDSDGNKTNNGWFYSGKSRSRTIILTEDEMRDRGGNIDELLAQARHGKNGKFYVVRPGLAVADLSLGLDLWGMFRPMATVGVGLALNPENALGNSFVGVETNLRAELYYEKILSFDIIASMLQAGQAAAAYVNKGTDRTATDPLFQFEAVLTVHF